MVLIDIFSQVPVKAPASWRLFQGLMNLLTLCKSKKPEVGISLFIPDRRWDISVYQLDH